MPKTVVTCSMPGCSEPATKKLAAPWADGRFAEKKTYGYACPTHEGEVLSYARKRPRPNYLGPGESLGEVVAHDLAGA